MFSVGLDADRKGVVREYDVRYLSMALEIAENPRDEVIYPLITISPFFLLKSVGQSIL